MALFCISLCHTRQNIFVVLLVRAGPSLMSCQHCIIALFCYSVKLIDKKFIHSFTHSFIHSFTHLFIEIHTFIAKVRWQNQMPVFVRTRVDVCVCVYLRVNVAGASEHRLISDDDSEPAACSHVRRRRVTSHWRWADDESQRDQNY